MGLLAAVLLTGCGVRLDTPPPTPAPPSVTEQARQSAALALQTIARYDGEMPTDMRPELVAHAAQQATILGGVWQDCRQTPACATKNPADIAPPSKTALTGLTSQANKALTDLAAGDDEDLALLASAITPVLRSDLQTDNARRYDQRNWTEDPQLLEALAWGVWQLDAAAAREPDAELVTLSNELRAAERHCAKTMETTSLPAFRTLEQPANLLLDELARQIAARLADVPAAERAPVIDLLQRLGDEITQRGGTLPASWLQREAK